MAGTAGPHEFSDTDRSSEDESAVNVAEYEGIRQELLEEHNIMNGEIVSLEQASEVLDLGNLEPYTGMTFQSLDNARDFYFEYAKSTGFTIRTNRIRHSLKCMSIIGRDFVCSREGFRAAKHTHRKDRVLPPRPVTREGCKAMIRLAARDGGKWVVTKFVREHSHKLMAHCKFPGELPTVNMLTEEEKDKKIQDLYNELQREKERSAAFQRQLQMILKDLEEHAEFMSIRVEEIVDSLKRVELDDCSLTSHNHR
ncbi:protein FAR1-RELATED SEQUENCE 5-like isoform X1 [Hibiscus syriacus]|uniref:Protein FAR1-RELATED SEQUENCE 5-like isoform X1 n=1 Tax=Hibiscus syriacus TaxID=106335 RepID=A0A6A3BQJ4_HIBSY|nr:protein FAR-RED ELONGATED HYPOCOTYL 3-like [Hibiscus syriacus]KAE8718337.1 protein FAR1-RELATED SEQUENCE 5-like isoform X1 [Hibiscus syriacus]